MSPFHHPSPPRTRSRFSREWRTRIIIRFEYKWWKIACGDRGQPFSLITFNNAEERGESRFCRQYSDQFPRGGAALLLETRRHGRYFSKESSSMVATGNFGIISRYNGRRGRENERRASLSLSARGKGEEGCDFGELRAGFQHVNCIFEAR